MLDSTASIEDLGVVTIDLSPDFKNHASPLSLFPYEEGRHLVQTQGLHYNREGHALVGRRILRAIEHFHNQQQRWR